MQNKNFFKEYLQNLENIDNEESNIHDESRRIYTQELNRFLRKGIHPRINEIRNINTFIDYLRDLKRKSQDEKRRSAEMERDPSTIEKIRFIAIRDTLLNLDLKKPEDKKLYNAMRVEVVNFFEGTHPTWKKKPDGSQYQKGDSYPDSANNITVGYGFNMSRKEAKKEWLAVFQNNNPSFEEVKNGAKSLSDEQMSTLLTSAMSVREKELIKLYGDSWNKMSANEQLMTESLYYNGGNTAVGITQDTRTGMPVNSRYLTAMKQYTKTGKPEDMEILYNIVNQHMGSFNNKTRNVPKRRRQLEAILGHSTAALNYIPPNKRGTFQKPNTFIWLHSGSSTNANQVHVKRHGKVFNVNGSEWEDLTSQRPTGCNCRYKYIANNKTEQEQINELIEIVTNNDEE